MGAFSILQILRVAGKLSVNPTNLATAWPHGGTGIGAVDRAYWQPDARSAAVRAEEFGGEVVEVVHLGDSGLLYAFLRAWGDNDALSTAWPNTSVGASTGDRVVSGPGSNRAGYKLSGKGVKLLFTPEADGYPGVLLHKAVPRIDVEERLRLTVTREMVTPVAFQAIRNSSGRAWDVAPLADLASFL